MLPIPIPRKLIHSLQKRKPSIARIFFPEMKTDWRTHPNNIGHKDWNGCFRCHDGNHKAADGKKTIAASDCNSCHLILAQGSGEQLKKLNADGYPFFHIDSEFSEYSCTTCHTGGPQLP